MTGCRHLVYLLAKVKKLSLFLEHQTPERTSLLHSSLFQERSSTQHSPICPRHCPFDPDKPDWSRRRPDLMNTDEDLGCKSLSSFDTNPSTSMQLWASPSTFFLPSDVIDGLTQASSNESQSTQPSFFLELKHWFIWRSTVLMPHCHC